MRRLLTAAQIAAAAALAAAGCSKPQDQAPPANAAAVAAPAETARGPGGPGVGLGQDQTLDQMLERTMNRFARLDANGDGQLSQDELTAPPQGGGQGGGPGAAAPGVSQGAAPGANGQGRRGFGGGRGLARDDANGDGVVTKAEVEAATRERFKRLDADGDGVVTRDELTAGFGGQRGPGDPGRGGGGPPPQQ